MKTIISFMAAAVLLMACPVQSKTSTSELQKIKARRVITDYGFRVGYISSGVQDRAGNTWFASTLQGVYRYDGKKFTNYTVKDGLSSDCATAVTEDKNGTIWVATENGACIFNGSSFTAVSVPAADGSNFLPAFTTKGEKLKRSNAVSFSKQTSNGDTWYWSGFNIYRYNGKSLVYALPGVSSLLRSKGKRVDTTYENPNIWEIFEDKKGNIWLTTGSCCCLNCTFKVDAKSMANPCVSGNCKHDMHNPQQAALHERELATAITEVTTKDGNRGIAFSSILEDKSGEIWIGTWDSGVYKYDGRNFTHFKGKNGLDHSLVGVMYEDRTGNIWFGTGAKNGNIYQGSGAFRYDGKSLTQYTRKDGLLNKGEFQNNDVTCIAEDKNGRVWICGDGGASYYDGKGFTSFGMKEGLSKERVSAIVPDHNGNIWFTTEDMGVFRYDGKGFTGFTEKKIQD